MFAPKLKDFEVNNLFSILAFLALVVFYKSPSLTFAPIVICLVALTVSIYSSVHYSETIAQRIGPSLGALLLAVAVTVIETGLIVGIMANNATDAPTIARDTVFATIMIVINGILGLSILIGGFYHKELGFQPQGTSSLLCVLAVLSTLAFILPNYTTSSIGPTYSEGQIIFASIASLALYASLVWAQTVAHKSYFQPISTEQFNNLEKQEIVPTKAKSFIAFIALTLSLITVIGLAKTISPALSDAVKYMNAPNSIVGIIVALLVLAPESLAALKAAKTNQLQTSLNLALGSGIASIALTIPIVSFYSIYSKQPLILGLDAKSTVLMILTFMTGGLTFSNDKTTVLQGVVHLIIMSSYLALAFMP